MKTISGITELHGIPKEMEIDEMKFLVVPLYHPAATIYRPKLWDDLVADFIKMSKLIDIHTDGTVIRTKNISKDKSLLDF